MLSVSERLNVPALHVDNARPAGLKVPGQTGVSRANDEQEKALVETSNA